MNQRLTQFLLNKNAVSCALGATVPVCPNRPVSALLVRWGVKAVCNRRLFTAIRARCQACLYVWVYHWASSSHFPSRVALSRQPIIDRYFDAGKQRDALCADRRRRGLSTGLGNTVFLLVFNRERAIHSKPFVLPIPNSDAKIAVANIVNGE